MKIVADYKRLTQQRGSLKTISIILLALIALSAGIFVSLQRTTSYATMEGKQYSWVSEHWTIVNYFAEWCQPCLRELPELNRFAKQSEVRVFGVSFDELSKVELQQVITRQSIEFPVFTTDAAADLPVAMPIVLPTTYIINPEGNVVATLRGEINADILAKRIEKAKSELL